MNALLSAIPVWLALLALVAWYLFQRRYEASIARTRAMEEKLAERRQKLYDQFMHQYWAKIVAGEMTPDKAVEFLQKWNREAWLVASDKVVKAVLRVIAGSETQEE